MINKNIVLKVCVLVKKMRFLKKTPAKFIYLVTGLYLASVVISGLFEKLPTMFPVKLLRETKVFSRNHLRGAVNEPLASMIQQITLSHTVSHNIEPANYSCNGSATFHGVEDILCLQPPIFLEQYKNPCWRRSGRGIGKFVCLPYFQLIGVAKCGTTDLFARILKHPSILHNEGFLQKETFWWSCKRYGHYITKPHKIENFSRYLQYFANASEIIRKQPKGDFITGDGNPRDMHCMGGWVHIPQNQGLQEPQFITPNLIKHMNPNVKLIVLLRDPVDRLYSDFFHRRKGNLTASGFDTAVRHSIAILHNCTLQNSLRWCLYSRDLQLRVTSRINMGFYYIFLKDWLDVFPRRQVLIFRNEDYKEHTKEWMQKIFQFLRVRNLTKAEMEKISTANRTRITKGKAQAGPMQDDARHILKDLYQPFNDKLAELLNDDKYLWSD